MWGRRPAAPPLQGISSEAEEPKSGDQRKAVPGLTLGRASAPSELASEALSSFPGQRTERQSLP